MLISDTEFDVLVSFRFNTGGIFKASLVKSLNAGDRKKAAAQFLNWKKPPAIIGRRRKEQKLFELGSYSNGRKAGLIKADGNGKILLSTVKSIGLTPFL